MTIDLAQIWDEIKYEIAEAVHFRLHQHTDVLSTSDVAHETGRTQETVQAWIRDGKLKAQNTATEGNPRYVIKRADLDDFLDRS